MTIFKINKGFITLNIYSKSEYIIYPYLKIKYLSNGKFIEYELIPYKQFNSLVKELKF